MMDKVEEVIIENYKSFEEDIRLENAFGKFQKIRTREMILGEIGNKNFSIIDVGGGTGSYSFWLADNGYKISLVDIVPRHIEIAKSKSKNHKKLKGIFVGDSRKLSFEDESVDIVMLHGSLYHLVKIEDRRKTLLEAKRVLKKKGKLLAFTINRYAGVNYGLASNMIFDDIYYSVIKKEVKSGFRDNNPKKINSFLEAYFHLPNEIEGEINQLGFEIKYTKGDLANCWNVEDLEEKLKSKKL